MLSDAEIAKFRSEPCPTIASLTSEQRLIRLNVYRQILSQNIELSYAEYSHMLELVASDRASIPQAKRKEAKAVKTAAAIPSIDDLI